MRRNIPAFRALGGREPGFEMGAVHVETARFADRDRVVQALAARGHETRPIDEDGLPAIEVPCGGDSEAACDDLIAELESLVGELDAPLVPIRGDGVVFLRPPAN